MEYKIIFTKDYSVDQKEGPHYKKGQVVDVKTQASMERFIRRNAAIAHDDTKKAVEIEKKAAEPDVVGEVEIKDEELKEGTMPWLKKQLDDAGVEYKSNASKGDLEDLYMGIAE